MVSAWNIVKKVIYKILIFAIFLYLLIHSTWIAYLLVMDTDRKHEVCITQIYDGFDYMHYSSGRRKTPDGIGYFCFGLDKNTGKLYAMRAKENWFNENFPGGVSKDPNGITITAVEFSSGRDLTDTLINKWKNSPVVDANGDVLPLGMEEGHFLIVDSDIALIFCLLLIAGSLFMVGLEVKKTISEIKGQDQTDASEGEDSKKKIGIGSYIELLAIIGFGIAFLYFNGRYGTLR